MALDSSRYFKTTLILPLCIKDFVIAYFILVLAYTGVDDSLFKLLWYGVIHANAPESTHALYTASDN